MASQRAVSSADRSKMPPAIGDAVAPFGSVGAGGGERDGAIYPAASRHNVQGYSKNPTHCKVSVYIWVHWCNSGASLGFVSPLHHHTFK
jgi:hypothetical protein